MPRRVGRRCVDLSPVASYAIFYGVNGVTQPFACVLRLVADRMTSVLPQRWRSRFNPHMFAADHRDVKDSTVCRIFDLLKRTVIG
jgi:hypothetical protein